MREIGIDCRSNYHSTILRSQNIINVAFSEYYLKVSMPLTISRSETYLGCTHL